ncbi:MAG TPA: bifunctional phosphoribosylaminoimidazolecarboxamide formyltransferase/IMP cyclohydrolase [Candidatus Limnocylindrales bacterium]|nr:bifunctional phosphoribosylaminoimidazolecarboxamide formyltransferase/IMP cyclohydrolase [Candidatus Limnocylindrales bacterium]
MNTPKRALISVSNKQGIVEFAQALDQMGFDLISTGGTATLLSEFGLSVKRVSDLTHFPEILNGRVKTLHPMIHGGILANLEDPQHVKEISEQGILPISLVVVNLYPFRETVSKPAVTLEEAIENIDIGGPTLLRAAAKNYRNVTVICDPRDYGKVLNELKQHSGTVSLETRFKLAYKAFAHTASYDITITRYLSSTLTFPDYWFLDLEKVQDLRYGENPHQRAALYRDLSVAGPSLTKARQLQGKELSFNNIFDLNAALELILEFTSEGELFQPAAAIIKHTNPCGVALGQSLAEAYRRARSCDPVSAFGGIVALNTTVDVETAQELTSTFIEAVIAPAFEEAALAVLQKKKNLRVLCLDFSTLAGEKYDVKKVSGGVLIQEKDVLDLNPQELKVVTKRQPTPQEMKGLRFAWKVVKHVKSNGIVYATETETVGIGAGQMSRVDASRIAIMKAQRSLQGTVVASDAFFPFRDGVDAAAEVGATAIIQPGGSLRDPEVIAAADEHGMAMVFTQVRHFKH